MRVTPLTGPPASSLHARARPGFTLTELLVVVAITVVLMFLVLAPLGQSFNLTARGQALVTGQDNVRRGMARFSRDLANAMAVYPRPMNIWAYSEYNTTSTEFPEPTANARPARTVAQDVCIDLVLPRHRYFCSEFRHHLTELEASADEAVTVCPRHPTSPVILRPLDPLQPDRIWVRYFIGLKEPAFPQNLQNGQPVEAVPPGQIVNGLPSYLNGHLFQGTVGSFDNTYILYRAEFDPLPVDLSLPGGAGNPINIRRAQTANWRLGVDANGQVLADPTTGGVAAGGSPYNPAADPAFVPNPNFFYDPDFRSTWKELSVIEMSPYSADLVRFVRAGNLTTDFWRVEPTVRFVPTPIQDDSAQPNRSLSRMQSEDPTSASVGARLSPELIAPTEYATDYGHWVGLDDDLALPVVPGLILSDAPPAGAPLTNYRYGPRIQVYAINTSNNQQVLVFDSADVNRRERLLTYDNRRGLVNFALRRSHSPGQANSASDTSAYAADVEPGITGDPIIDLGRDQATRGASLGGVNATLPSAFGSARAVFGGTNADGSVVPGPTRVVIVPGTEVVSRLNVASGVAIELRRVGWTGIPEEAPRTNVNRYQSPRTPDEYSIDYTTGVITLFNQDPSLLAIDPASNNPEQIWVRYQFQTNQRVDAVRVTYSTRELITINMGVVQYSARGGEVLPVAATQKVQVRNMSR